MDKYENNLWRSAFENAAIMPPEKVWDKIDAVLANKESGSFKKRIFFFQLLAAASVSLAIGFGIYTVYNANKPTLNETIISDSKISETQLNKQNPETKEELLTSKNEASIAKPEDEKISIDKNSQAIELLKDETRLQKQNAQNPKIVSNEESSISDQNTYEFLVAVKQRLDWPTLKSIKIDVHKVHFGFYQSVEEEKKATRYPLMAGLNVGTGTVNSEPGSIFGVADAAPSGGFSNQGRNQPMNTESNAVSYAIGINVGKKIAPRWILQTGLQYTVQSADATTNAFYEDANNQTKTPVLYSELAGDFIGDLDYSSTIDLTNSFELLTIPVQIGYLIVDKKITWMISSGIATDIFLKNKLTSNTAGFEDVVVKPGSNSPFRTAHFSGLFSTEVGYKLGKHYNLSLEPSLKAALHTFTKDGQSIERKPISLGIGIKLRYVFGI